ncbi:MAG: hypothetical protein QXN63_00500 [Candidatus Bathyarchaeia archaeon]
MEIEKAIHFTMFILILLGLWGVTAWILFTVLNSLAPQIVLTLLSWGIILAILYLLFKNRNWEWWS